MQRVASSRKSRTTGLPLFKTAAFAAALTCSGFSHALPQLQLTVAGGTYIGGTVETTEAQSSVFTLYALADPASSGPFYIDAALVKGTAINNSPLGSAPLKAGSFVFAGQTFFASADLAYGRPAQIPKHGEYDTFFVELPAFNFSGQKTAAFNAETFTPSDPLSAGCVSNCLYFAAFTVDTTNLDPAYSLHFDLYNKDDNGKVDSVAPFSHDAQSDPPASVPEPGPIALLAISLVGLAVSRRAKFLR